MRTNLFFVIMLSAASLLLAPRAFAGTATGSFNVYADVESSCTIAAPDMNFGTYDPINGTTATTTVTITCSGIPDGTEVDYTVDGGQYYAAATRNMNSVTAADTLPYTLSASAGGADIGTASDNGITILSGGVGTEILYGSIPAGTERIAATDYTDNVGLSVTY